MRLSYSYEQEIVEFQMNASSPRRPGKFGNAKMMDKYRMDK